MGNDAEFAAVTAELNAGRLWPTVDAVYPLSEGHAAFERMARGEQFGKLVLRVSDG
jgi:NADPH:quinone reductase-like Zn-dependent oxidoreductase